MLTGYYAAIIRDTRTALLLGPYATHLEAARNLKRAFEMALKLDGFVWFDVPGIYRIEAKKLPPGKLNSPFDSAVNVL